MKRGELAPAAFTRPLLSWYTKENTRGGNDHGQQRQTPDWKYSTASAIRRCTATPLWALRDHHQAEEAVQETFLSALPKAAEVTALDRPEGWLMQTVKHKVLHLRREQDRRRARMLPLEEKLPAPDRLGQWEESEDAALLWQQATQRLSPQEAELLRLVALEEQSQQAAAEEMGLSLWACQKRLQRIRKSSGPSGCAVRCWRRCCSPPSSPFLRRARNACSRRG